MPFDFVTVITSNKNLQLFGCNSLRGHLPTMLIKHLPRPRLLLHLLQLVHQLLLLPALLLPVLVGLPQPLLRLDELRVAVERVAPLRLEAAVFAQQCLVLFLKVIDALRVLLNRLSMLALECAGRIGVRGGEPGQRVLLVLVGGLCDFLWVGVGEVVIIILKARCATHAMVFWAMVSKKATLSLSSWFSACVWIVSGWVGIEI